MKYLEYGGQDFPPSVKLSPKKQRIEYIDLAKGFSILWVVLLHSSSTVIENITEVPWHSWLFVPYRMSLFFFISGIFFRLRPFNEFIYKRIKTLIVPFLGFWLIGFLYNVIKYELIGRFISMNHLGIGSFIEYATSLKGLFYLRPEIDPSVVNSALWFLLVSFIIQFMHFFCYKFINSRLIILLIGIVLFIASIYLAEQKITGIFYITNIFKFYIFYIAGNFFGNILVIKLEKRNGYTKRMLIFSSLVLIIASFVNTDNLPVSEVLLFIRTICIFPIAFEICKTINHFKIIAPIKYFGMHSLELLVTHIPLLNLINIIIFKGILVQQHIGLFLHERQHMFILFFICILLEYFFVIKFCNKYLYFFLGKPENALAPTRQVS